MSLEYVHADVFTSVPYSGNSLAVFPNAPDLATDQMLRITQELRHFETIFLQPEGDGRTVTARVFDLIEELPFAGHPVIGAAAVMQHQTAPDERGHWRFKLGKRVVNVDVEPVTDGYRVRLDQGRPQPFVPVDARQEIAAAYSLDVADLHPGLPLEVGDTGLRYLVIPLTAGAIGRAGIKQDITSLMQNYGARFGVLFDPATLEQRHWNNDGIIEDVATGSAAGVVAAYARRHGIIPDGVATELRQGRFTGRPSVLTVWARGSANDIASVHVGGGVALVGTGVLWHIPPTNALSAPGVWLNV